MARKLRIEYAGAMYHVVNRGNYRQDLFSTTGAAEAFLGTLAEAVGRFGWRLYAYILMRNHFHLALETREPNLVDGMHWLQTTIAVRFNRFRGERGHLFQGRYHSGLIEDYASLARVVDYIHLNPVRARVVPVALLAGYRWSSLIRFLRGPRPEGLAAGEWLQARGGWSDNPEGWREYLKHLQSLAADEEAQRSTGVTDLGRSWAIGTVGWRRALARDQAQREVYVGLERAEARELKEVRWSELLGPALCRHGKQINDLNEKPRLSRWRLEVARELRTAGASVTWIAGQLQFGKPATLRSYLCRFQ